MRTQQTASVAVASLVLGAVTGWAVCPELRSRWGYGQSLAVATTATHVLCGAGSVLVIADADASGPGAVVAELTLPGAVQDIVVAGTRAYVAAGDAGLRVIDIATPATPLEVGGLDTEEAVGVAVAGSLAYVADGWYGLRVVDVANPVAPVEIAHYDPPGWEGVRGVAVAGTVAYLANGSAGLITVDVANPFVPKPLATLAMPDNASAVAVAGGTAFVAANRAGLRVVDVTRPAAPREIGALDTTGYSNDVVVAGTRAYVADGSGGLVAVDVSVPASPVRVGAVFGAQGANQVALRGGTAYVAAGFHGLLAAAVGGPGTPVALPAPAGPPRDYAESVALTGNLAVVGHPSLGVQVLDLTDPAAPVERGAVTTFGASSVVVSGTRVYALTSSSLRVVDISNPDAPALRGSVPLPDYGWHAAAVGSHVLVADGAAGLVVVDVSNPATPAVVTTLAMPGQAKGVAVIGSHAVVVGQGTGVRVVDVSSLAAPVEVAALPGYDDARDLAAWGSHAVVAGGNDGLFVIDVSSPAHPVEVASVTHYSTMASSVDVAGDHAFVDFGSLRVFSLTDPAHPAEVGSITLPAGTADIATAAPLVVAALGDAGIAVLDGSECSLAPLPEIAVYSGETNLSDGQAAPIVLGTAVAGAGKPPRLQLVIDNEGSAPLTVTSLSVPPGFIAEASLPAVLAPTEAIGVTLLLDTSLVGNWGGALSIASDDADEDPFTFAVAGTVTAAPPRRFDFGTGGSPVETGYQGVTPATVYTPLKGYGWRTGAIAGRDRGAGTALTRDLNFTAEGTFVLDLPLGWWNVTVTIGDRTNAHDSMGVYLEGNLVATWSTAANQSRTGTFLAKVDDGQLTVTLKDLGGSDTAAVVNALVVTAGLPQRFDLGTASSPVASGHTRVTNRSTYSAAAGFGWTAGSIGSRDRGSGGDVRRDFNTTVAGTFVVDVANGTYDVALTLGDAAYAHDQVGVYLEGVLVDTVTTAAGAWYARTYPATVADGQLTVAFADLGGSDGVTAVAAIEVLKPTRQFDFGTPTSPLEPGYLRVAHDTRYGAAAGFGWLSGTVESRDRGVGSARDRDLNFTRVATFAVELPNGAYHLTATMGDIKHEHDLAAVDAEGKRLGMVTTAAGEIVQLANTATVKDSQLTVVVQDLGGSDPNAAITALVVVPN